MKKGLLICLDGSDCSFKQTNTQGLYNKLLEENLNVIKLSYPDYESDSSALVKMYLDGKFGEDLDSINPYTASTFYAVDRYASYITKWKDFYLDQNIVLTDRYATSNMIHQAAKIEDVDERNKYLDWLWDLEYVKNGIPIPDLVIFLDMPHETGLIINKNRPNKITGKSDKDIHEKNPEFLRKSYKNALWIAKKYGWKRVSCVKSNHYTSVINGIPDNVRSQEDILNEIYGIVLDAIKIKLG